MCDSCASLRIVSASQDDHEKAVIAIAKAARPRSDPVYGNDGPLLRAWGKIDRGRT